MIGKNKILLFEAYPFFSGSQRITHNLCLSLKEEGFNITLLIVDDRFGTLKERFSSCVDEIVCIESHPILCRYGEEDSWFAINNILKAFFMGLLPYYLKVIRYIQNNSFNFLYCCDPRGATYMLLPAYLFKGKSILHFHGKNRLPSFFSKIILKIFDQVICVSNDVSNSLPDSINKKTIYNGIDFLQYNNSNVLESKLFSMLPNELVNRKKLLFVGLIKPHKGVHRLIYALNELKGRIEESKFPVLFLLGVAKTEAEINYREKLINYCKDNKIDKYIYWLGWKDNVLTWMKSVDYFIFPTIDKEFCEFEGFDEIIESTEGSPIVLVEASLVNCFSVASNVTGVSETITQNQNGRVFSSQNPYDLVNELENLILNNPVFLNFPNKNNFSNETFKREMLNVFK